MAKKPHQTLKNLGRSTAAWAVASCLALSGVPLTAAAAGLGKVTVLSALGQPLRAEVELAATREELADMKAQLASPETFRQAGVDYASTLQAIRFTVDRRQNGQPVIRLSSDRPINDPFVDLLLELTWASGRLVREYTFLLDPPEAGARALSQGGSATPPTSAPLSAAANPPAGVPAQAESVRSPEKVAPAATAARESRRPAPVVAPSAPAARAEAREVKRGENLQQIASEMRPEGVSLDQMLVGLLRTNQDAFEGGNMNRLRAGKILSMPDPAALATVSEPEARRVVLAQASDWHAYRRKMAGLAAQAEVKDDGGRQDASGKISARVDDKAAAPAENRDQVRVSRTETAPAASAVRNQEELIAKDKALQEANERLARLEKNVADLQRLLEMKNLALADLQKQAAAPAAVAAATKPPVETPAATAPAAPPAPVESAPPAAPASVTPVAAESTAAPSAAAPVSREEPPVAATASVSTPAAATPPPVMPADVAAPSFGEELLENPVNLGAVAAVLALLATYLALKRRRQEKAAAVEPTLGIMPPATGDSATKAVIGDATAKTVNTAHVSALTDFSQAGPGSIDTDEVDAVAEAEVYMAYGRDAQAEEILLEARQKEPARRAIVLKLLEIYAKRNSLPQFGPLALELHRETGGVGSDWEKAAEMGARIDPENPLYGGALPPVRSEPDVNATMVVSRASLAPVPPIPEVPLSVADLVPPVAPPAEALSPFEPPVVKAPEAPEPDLGALDFDLGFDEPASTASPASAADELDALDFDAAFAPVSEAPPAPLQPELVDDAVTSDVGADDASLNFELPDLPPPVVPVPAPTPAEDDFGLDFDLASDLPEIGAVDASSSGAPALRDEGAGPAENPATSVDPFGFGEADPFGDITPDEPSIPPAFDLSAINLDLDEDGGKPDARNPESDSPAPGFESSEKSPSAEIPDDFPDFTLDDLEPPSSSSVSEAMPETPPVRPTLPDTLDLDDFPDEPAVSSPEVPSAPAAAAPADEAINEEVATKLDLARAYEEMGDKEGARELLVEVLVEGNAMQKEQAELMMARIGG